jgi:DNA-binding transcriptional LysR family regulator
MVPAQDIVAVPIVDPVLRRDITLAWRAGRRQSPATAAFLELALELFGEGAEGRANRP